MFGARHDSPSPRPERTEVVLSEETARLDLREQMKHESAERLLVLILLWQGHFIVKKSITATEDHQITVERGFIRALAFNRSGPRDRARGSNLPHHRADDVQVCFVRTEAFHLKSQVTKKNAAKAGQNSRCRRQSAAGNPTPDFHSAFAPTSPAS